MNIFIIEKYHKILQKGRSLGGRQSKYLWSSEIIDNYTVKKVDGLDLAWAGIPPPKTPAQASLDRHWYY